MIHGGFCGGWVFDDFKAPFAEVGYRVETPTLRHHRPDPPKALATTSLLDYAADLEAEIVRLDEAPILLGHSLGGLLAQMLAARGLARAAVLLAPSAPWGIYPTSMFEVAAAQALYLNGDFWNKIIEPHYDSVAVYSLGKLPAQRREELFSRFVPESGLAAFEASHWAFDLKRASYVSARKVTCPLLCLSGSEDKVNPPKTVRHIAERYDGRAVFAELAGKSHWLIGEEGWQDVAARILAWLDEVLPTLRAEEAG
jgi:non-heme chloroperoxidase